MLLHAGVIFAVAFVIASVVAIAVSVDVSLVFLIFEIEKGNYPVQNIPI